MIRLGRALHWLSLAFAALALAVGAMVGMYSVWDAYDSQQHVQEWDAREAEKRKFEEDLRVADANGDLIAAQEAASGLRDIESEYHSSFRPYESEPYLGPALFFGLIGAFFIALIGRGARYILAGE